MDHIPDKMRNVHIENIRSAAAWAAISKEWNALLSASHPNVPFLTFEFQNAWWQALGGGEWEHAELNLLVGRNESGTLIGIAPLFSTEDGESKTILQFIGSHEIADYLDLIVRPADHSAFVQAIVDHLAANADWQRIELYNLLDSSPTLQALRIAAQSNGLVAKQETLQPSPYIVVPESLDAYIDSLDAKQAHELRRKLRRAARNPEPIALEIITERSQLDAALPDFFRLMANERHKADFLTPAMRAQMELITRAAADAGWLQLAFLTSGSQRIAASLNFDYDNCIWAYNSGFDPDFAHLSPGWLIMVEMIKWCIANQRTTFDFMRGGEDYKYHFGAVDRFVHKVTITRK